MMALRREEQDPLTHDYQVDLLTPRSWEKVDGRERPFPQPALDVEATTSAIAVVFHASGPLDPRHAGALTGVVRAHIDELTPTDVVARLSEQNEGRFLDDDARILTWRARGTGSGAIEHLNYLIAVPDSSRTHALHVTGVVVDPAAQQVIAPTPANRMLLDAIVASVRWRSW